MQQHAISWFEIPTTDIDRAQRFYESIFQFKMNPMQMPNFDMRMFPVENMSSVGGALVKSADFYTPSSEQGTLIYLNGNPDVQIILDRVESAGGKVVLPKTEITPEYGYMAIIIDTEGNRIGLHSVPASYLQQQEQG